MKRFPRGSMWHGEGSDPAEMLTCRVVAANYVNYTVDVVSQHDQKRFFAVPVGSPYLHPQNGEGIYVMPEVGAWCRVCVPSDTTPPFVVCFVMPSRIEDGSGPGAPQGAQPKGAVTEFANNASFSGNREKSKGGDIVMRGRDENFVVLHRGGVLQIGSTPLCQSVYIPMGNVLQDVSQRYEHLNSAGSVRWGIQDGGKTPAEYQQVFRVLGSDKYADIKVAIGTVSRPWVETPAQSLSDLTNLGIGTQDPIVYELALTPGGYADTGDLQTGVTSKLRIFFDRAGGSFLRTEGNVLVAVKKKLKLKLGSLEVAADSVSIAVSGDVSIQGGTLGVTAGVVKLNGGGSPVARQGDIVQVTFPFTPVMASPSPLPISGVILTGNATVLG